ncbi:anti-sigma factor [Pseudomonas sp. GD03696]|uniref:zf-HC2 domain-containing protein n=1 Tax=Pseudomonas sp. GD03696 TaxID=2975368 RepID=UPI0024468D84|nr:anti-sigma factor [Pseudomonas sp. GD03696]MDH1932814.1 zf-HC2 domain-containing protein [Pseudomonas sp. GD03696]
MLNCREMSELGSEIIDGHLKLRTRWAVMMHMRMCPRCKMYIKQLKVTSEVLQKMSFKDDSIDPHVIIEKLRGPKQ